jgi:dihydrofolate reductase
MIIIAAMDAQRGIGKNNKLPWKLAEDMAFFKRTTTGHTVIMGRKTFDSIGRPLPNRRNIVVTRNPEWSHAGVEVVTSMGAAAAIVAPDVPYCFDFVIGGAELYAAALPLATSMYITEIAATYECDTFFPEINKDEWSSTWQETVQSLTGGPDYTMVLYTRTLGLT